MNSPITKLADGRYTVGQMIGTGGMADVYLGLDTRLNREVAIKVLRRDLAKDPAFVARFRKEALAAGGLNHPGIVAVYDSGEENNSPYIVMELVSGQTLRQKLQAGQLPLSTSLEIIKGILQALDYSHSKGIVHRDVKPGNIMITDSGDIKVMDLNFWMGVRYGRLYIPSKVFSNPASLRRSKILSFSLKNLERRAIR